MSDIKKNKTIEIISKIIKTDLKEITEASSMGDFTKWDSLSHLQIMLEVEKQFKKKISTSKMSDLNSVKKILKFIES
tara:strand:+ start:1250 stop:1480 length:231 start_codon:yes stop_codon:yes gene_type:complete